MAEAVHAVLEEMIPELDDLQKRGIFVEKEIKEIVKQRTDFEYNLHRRITEKSHYLRSIEVFYNIYV
jgi:U3 small nucleolar RNA-associated protein 6